ncbi:hypothetical protein IAQ61_001088 [Plenodomus lingam]|uniref:uncharacterized protein n=1 Tax=Leptosphaeria maculans TaxID=5022 RepID=UPI003332D932|nr:hypothetical protein IAQ61_001088 [Plenodomus lingam]
MSLPQANKTSDPVKRKGRQLISTGPRRDSLPLRRTRAAAPDCPFPHVAFAISDILGLILHLHTTARERQLVLSFAPACTPLPHIYI